MTSYNVTINTNPSGGTSFSGYFVVDSGHVITAFYETGNLTSILDTTSYDGTHVNDHTYISSTNTWGNVYLTSLGTIITSGGPYLIYNSGANAKDINVGIGSTSILIDVTETLCFNEGTKILCLNNKGEEYVPIEQLKKGDIVKSYKYGYRKIDLIDKNCLINNPDKFRQCMYTMKKTDTNKMIDDLTVTGGHSILVDDLGEQKELNYQMFKKQTPMIEDKYLLLAAASDKFEKVINTDTYTYYHFVLENNGNDDEQFGVWANGVLTETMSKNFFLRL